MFPKRVLKSSTGSPIDDPFRGPDIDKWKPDLPVYDFLPNDREFSISQHSRLLHNILKDIELSHFLKHNTFTMDTAILLAPRMCKILGIKMYKKDLVIDSLIPKFASRPVNKRLMLDVAMLLAGNKNILQADRIIVPNYNLEYPAWIPMIITDVISDINEPLNKKVTFFAEAGIFAGSIITKYMTSKFIKFVLSQIGVPRRSSVDVLNLFNTRFSVLMVRDKTGSGMSEFHTSTSQEKYNKSLFKIRLGDRPCPEGMTCECQECLCGIDRCEYAVYKKSEKEIKAI